MAKLLQYPLNLFLQPKTKQNEKINTDYIDEIRMATTVATNALLERKGVKFCLLLTKGFKVIFFKLFY